MNRKHNSSREQLISSAGKRIRHIMVRTLESFEERFPDVNQTKSGEIFKAGIRTIFNDMIRAQRDELHDYDVEYRPIRNDEGNRLYITKTFMETVQKYEFDGGSKPRFRIFGSENKMNVMTALRAEFGCGVIYTSNNSIIFEVAGLDACLNCVICILDRLRLQASVKTEYIAWKEELIKEYRS